MLNQKWAILCATIAATAILAGCGGDAETLSFPATADRDTAPLVRFSADVNDFDASSPLAMPARSTAPITPTLAAVKDSYVLSNLAALAALAALADLADLADRDTARIVLSPAAATDEFSGKRMIGFTNVGATCYANAALKFLIHSIGPGALISHLKTLSETDPTIGLTPIQQFIDLIKIAHEPADSTKDALTSFFHTLDGTGNFFLGEIIGKPEGSSYFYSGLANTFNIEKINNGGFSLIKKTIYPGGAETTEQQSNVLHQLKAYENQLDLQTLVNTYSLEVDAALESQYEFQVSDEKALKTVNFMVGIEPGVTTDQLNFNDTVTIPVVNRSNGKRFTAKLKAKSLVFPTNSSAAITHYVAYLKYDEDGFSLHDDGSVIDNVKISSMNYPELISFSVESIEAAP